MKIAACDFDGTLYREGGVSADDLAAIGEWRRGGNVFGIVTGRGRATLLRDVTRGDVPYDFLICNNGAMICDERARAVSCATLPEAARPGIVRHPGMRACAQCAFFAGVETFASAEKTEYWILRDHVLPRLSPEEAIRLPGLHQISLAYAEPENPEKWAKAIAETCGENAGVHFSNICIDITAPDVSKAAGLERLLPLRRWEDAEILVIGDDRNDLPMIARFNGFAVADAAADVRAAASGVFLSVGRMLRERG